MDESVFWDNYFNVCTLSISIFFGMCIFAKRITKREVTAIAYTISYKVVCLLYLIIGYIIKKDVWMEKNIGFIVALGSAGFLAWFLTDLYKKHIYEI